MPGLIIGLALTTLSTVVIATVVLLRVHQRMQRMAHEQEALRREVRDLRVEVATARLECVIDGSDTVVTHQRWGTTRHRIVRGRGHLGVVDSLLSRTPAATQWLREHPAVKCLGAATAAVVTAALVVLAASWNNGDSGSRATAGTAPSTPAAAGQDEPPSQPRAQTHSGSGGLVHHTTPPPATEPPARADAGSSDILCAILSPLLHAADLCLAGPAD